MNIDRLQRAIRAVGDDRGAMRREAEAAEAGRQAIHDDVRFVPKDKEVRRRQRQALDDVSQAATARVAAAAEAARRALVEGRDEIEQARPWATSLTSGGKDAGPRIHAALDAGVHLGDLIERASRERDSGGLEYLMFACPDLVAAQVATADPNRVGTREVQSLARDTYEAIVNRLLDLDVLAPNIGGWHRARRELDQAEQLLAADTDYWLSVAAGTATAHGKMRYGFATDERWQVPEQGTFAEPTGPVEVVAGVTAGDA